jgi:hypothetical protein
MKASGKSRNPANSILSIIRIAATLAILVCLPGAAPSHAAELKQATVEAWDGYVRTVNSAMSRRAAGDTPFLWVDESPDLLRRVQAGEVLVAAHDLVKVPHGLLHHWMGAMFLRNVTLDDVTRVLNDYDRYAEFYRPFVVKSKLVDDAGDRPKITMLMVQKAFSVTAAVEADDEIRVTKLDPHRLYSSSNSVRIQEFANYGRRDEQRLPEGQGPGYIWRTFGITRLVERDGGVYVEMESIALSRGIPFEFRWLIKPLTEKLPREIMFDTLNKTEAAVRREAGAISQRNQNIAQKY